MNSYASGTDFLARYDARLFGDLVNDDGSREPSTTLATHPTLLAALADAYSEIISAIVVGGRYTLAQLDPANLNPQALQLLIRINCDGAMLLLKQRRGRMSEKDLESMKSYKERIKALQDGAGMLLGIMDTEAQASVLDLGQPQLIPIRKRNTIATRVSEYYPARWYGDRQQYTNNGQ